MPIAQPPHPPTPALAAVLALQRDRVVLIMRHWHPELTLLERVAVQFLFESLDEGSPAGVKAAAREAGRRLKELAAAAAPGGGKKKKKKGALVGGGGGGFGKR
jgi:hypothetical protein